MYDSYEIKLYINHFHNYKQKLSHSDILITYTNNLNGFTDINSIVFSQTYIRFK